MSTTKILINYTMPKTEQGSFSPLYSDLDSEKTRNIICLNFNQLSYLNSDDTTDTIKFTLIWCLKSGKSKDINPYHKNIIVHLTVLVHIHINQDIYMHNLPHPTPKYKK